MKREDAREFLIKLGIENPTEEQITTYLNRYHADIESEKEKADKYKSDAEKLAQAEKELEELKAKSMTEQERVLAEMKKAQEDALAREKDFTIRSNRLEIEKMLVAGGLKEEDYGAIIDHIVTADLEKSKELATALVKTVSDKIEVAKAEKEKELLESTKKPNGGVGGGGTTLTPQEELAKSVVNKSENDKETMSAEDIIKTYS